MNKTELKGSLLVLLAGSLWGTIGIYVKHMAAAGANTPSITFYRIFFALILMTGICLVKFGPKAFLVNKRTLAVCALLGIICHGIYNICYNMAVTLAGVSVAAVLLYIAPMFTLIFSMLLFREKLTLIKVLAILLNILGCVFAATKGNFDVQTLAILGILCGIGAGLSYSLSAIIGRLAIEQTNTFIISVYCYLFASLSILIWILASGSQFTFSGEIAVWGGLYALIPTTIGYLVYYFGISFIKETSKVPILTSSEMIVASIIGILIYKETFNLITGTGIILVLVSIAILQITKASCPD